MKAVNGSSPSVVMWAIKSENHVHQHKIYRWTRTSDEREKVLVPKISRLSVFHSWVGNWNGPATTQRGLKSYILFCFAHTPAERCILFWHCIFYFMGRRWVTPFKTYLLLLDSFWPCLLTWWIHGIAVPIHLHSRWKLGAPPRYLINESSNW